MRDHSLKPDIENHYHIEHLIHTQEKRVADREGVRTRKMDFDQRATDISKLQKAITTDFFCEKCQLDFKSQSILETQQDWNDVASSIAFYRAKCPKHHWCIRHAIDKLRDRFFIKSKNMRADRRAFQLDMLQPHESGFNMLYKKI